MGAEIETVDELLYANLILFRLDYPKIKFIINFELDCDTFRIALYHISAINIQLNNNKIELYKEGISEPSYIPSSSDFIYPIIVNNDSCYKESETNLFRNRKVYDGLIEFINTFQKPDKK